MSGLMMASKGANFVTRAEAFRTDILPVKTRTYCPVTNLELVNMVEKISGEHGLTLIDEDLGMAGKNSQQFFATYIIQGKDFFDNQIKMMLGVVNSYDKTLTAKILFGSMVSICSNKSFYAGKGENGISSINSRKHTSQVFSEGNGLFYKLNKSLELVDHFCREQEKFCEQLKDRNLSRDEAYSTIVRSARSGVICKTNILSIADQWDFQENEYPDTEIDYNNWHKEFKPRNCYSLFNCYTESNKKRLEKNIVSASLDTLRLTEFFNKEFVLN